MEEKNVTKHVKFDFYEVDLQINEDTIISLIAELKKEMVSKPLTKKSRYEKKIKTYEYMLDNPDEYSKRYNLDNIINCVKSKEIKSCQDILDKLAELDTATFMPKDEKDADLVYFQITNCRDTNIPSRKKLGQKRVDIKLAEDEYIGEFMGLLYSKPLSILMVQLNKYALSTRQLENFLNALRYDYLKLKNLDSEQNSILRIALIPILDPNILKNIDKKNNFTKLKVRCSDQSLLPLAKDNNKTLYGIEQTLNYFRGMNIEIEISVDSRKKEYHPLNSEAVAGLYEDFCELTANKPNIEVNYKDGAKTDAINWLLPKVQSIIDFHIKPRHALGYEYVYQNMLANFRAKQERLGSILANKERKNE